MLVNNGVELDTVKYTITPHKGTCNGPDSIYTVAVQPKPKLMNSSLFKAICDSSYTNILLLRNMDSTRFTWTCTATSPNLSGYSSNTINPDTIINQLLRNNGLTVDTVIYHILPNAFGCAGDNYNFRVAVYPEPNLTTTPLFKSICDNAFTNISLTSGTDSTDFTWIAWGSSVNVSGYSSSSVPALMINQQLHNTSFSNQTVTYRIVPHTRGCDGDSVNYTVTVFPTPDLSNVPKSTAVCSNTTTNILLTSHVAGTQFTWRAIGSSFQVSGYSSNTIPVTTINQLLVNNGFNVETVTYRLMPSANGCNGDSVDFIVTVYPVADVYFVPSSQIFCSGLSTGLTLHSHVTGATFTWTARGSSLQVTGYGPGSGSQIQQTLLNTGIIVEEVWYKVTPVAHSCTGTPDSALVSVKPVPVVSLPVCFDDLTFINAKPINLTGGVPPGGTYSGLGVTSAIFYPAVAGTGTHNISYSYTNTFGCLRTSIVPITVLPIQPFTCGNVFTDIRDLNTYPTVQIGGQCWTAANLNYGTEIPSSQAQRDNCIPEKYCYNDDPAFCALSSVLYQWDEMMRYNDAPGIQGFCPPTWHIPTEAEWNTLFTNYISSGFAGSPLKYTGYSGFNALLNGVRFNGTTWSFSNFATMIWSSASHGPNKAWAHGMNEYNYSVSFYPSSRSNAFSVRCVHD
jgi:uncharacterized protein (TIGR02145 family)